MKNTYLKIAILIAINSLGLMCNSQEIENSKNDSTIKPKSIPEQLGLISYENKPTINEYFDPNNFEIRIWKNEFWSVIDKIKLWQLSKIEGNFVYKEYNYNLTAIYYKHHKIVYDKYDSLLWRRLPVIGGNGVIGYIVSNLNVISNNELAKEIYDKLVACQIFQLYSYDFQIPCVTYKNAENTMNDDEIVGSFNVNYTIEIISKKFYISYRFDAPPKNVECKEESKGLSFAKDIIKILKEK